MISPPAASTACPARSEKSGATDASGAKVKIKERPASAASWNIGEPELFAQLDEPLTPEREDGRHSIDHQMIMEQRETGKSRQFSGNCELSRSSWPIQEKEFHPQRLDPTSRSENHRGRVKTS